MLKNKAILLGSKSDNSIFGERHFRVLLKHRSEACGRRLCLVYFYCGQKILKIYDFVNENEN